MCNKYRSRLAIDALLGLLPDLQTPEGRPNLEPRDEISITDTAPVIRLDAQGRPELVQRRWSWPGPGGKPVYNFRSEGRRFASGRCLIPADGFYEFTDPEPPAPPKTRSGRARKTRWLFTMAGRPWFCIAGLIRPLPQGPERGREGGPEGGSAEAWTMLTTAPGPDIAPYHDRQVVVLDADDARAWLRDAEPERRLRPSPPGALHVERAPAA